MWVSTFCLFSLLISSLYTYRLIFYFALSFISRLFWQPSRPRYIVFGTLLLHYLTLVVFVLIVSCFLPFLVFFLISIQSFPRANSCFYSLLYCLLFRLVLFFHLQAAAAYCPGTGPPKPGAAIARGRHSHTSDCDIRV